MRRKEERSKQGQTNNKEKQHSTPKAVTFPKKNELPRVGHVHERSENAKVCTRDQRTCTCTHSVLQCIIILPLMSAVNRGFMKMCVLVHRHLSIIVSIQLVGCQYLNSLVLIPASPPAVARTQTCTCSAVCRKQRFYENVCFGTSRP